MKNIYVLPTDKPSRLFIDEFLELSEECIVSEDDCENQNIYITSDEEIKKGDWIYGLFNGGVILKSEFNIPKNSQYYKEYGLKIILTTDQDLIKDRVQAIDDDFLEWFVKNPTCEFVGVDYVLYQANQNNPVTRGSTNLFYQYKIIFPKKNFYCGADVGSEGQCLVQCKQCNGQEYDDYCYQNVPKRELFITVQKKSLELNKEFVESKTVEELNSTMSEFDDKQQTLEEAAENFYPPKTTDLICSPKLVRDAFVEGSKWQEQQQDNFAIEFAEWVLDRFTFKDFIHKETKELLEIFKKEKGL